MRRRLKGRRNNLRLLRVGHSLTQEDMADKLQVTRGTYVLIETGKSGGNRKFWERLQETFNIPNEEMYSLMQKEESEHESEIANADS